MFEVDGQGQCKCLKWTVEQVQCKCLEWTVEQGQCKCLKWTVKGNVSVCSGRSRAM